MGTLRDNECTPPHAHTSGAMEDDEWKDFSCATPWETFVSECEARLRAALAAAAAAAGSADVCVAAPVSMDDARYLLVFYRHGSACVPAAAWDAGTAHLPRPWLDVRRPPARAAEFMPPACACAAAGAHAPAAAALTAWFGVREFALLLPAAHDSELRGGVAGATATALLGGVSIAAAHMRLCLPVFVRARVPSRRAFIGTVAHAGMSARFDTDALDEVRAARAAGWNALCCYVQ